jgi:hypothetical protein
MDPILIAIAGALAKEAVPAGAKYLGQLVQRVKEKFAQSPGTGVVLATAQRDPEDPKMIEMLAEVLDQTEQADPAFGAELRTLWETAKTEITVTHTGDVITNTFTGRADGFFIQAGKISGGIHRHDD